MTLSAGLNCWSEEHWKIRIVKKPKKNHFFTIDSKIAIVRESICWVGRQSRLFVSIGILWELPMENQYILIFIWKLSQFVGEKVNKIVNLSFWNSSRILIIMLHDLVCCLVHEIASYLMRFLSEFGKRIFENDCMSIKGYLNSEHNFLKDKNTKLANKMWNPSTVQRRCMGAINGAWWQINGH